MYLVPNLRNLEHFYIFFKEMLKKARLNSSSDHHLCYSLCI